MTKSDLNNRKDIEEALLRLNYGTRKYVLTGGPGCGKTAVLTILASLGEVVVPEAAEDYIRQQKLRGVKDPIANPLFERQVLLCQIEREINIPIAPRVFFDRGLLDALAYYQKLHRRLDPLMDSVIQIVRKYRLYQKIFILEHTGQMVDNGVRTESLSEALALERLQRNNYRMAGYEVVIIPNISLEERARMILSYCD